MFFNLAAHIDHTILKEGTTPAGVKQVCVEALSEKFAAVCIPPAFVADAKNWLGGPGVKVATVIAFPKGDGHWKIKVDEIKQALAQGADEVDMVISLYALKEGNLEYLALEITECLKPVRDANKVIKVIVESGMLTGAELKICCELYGKYKIDYMKTSTGFATAGATIEAVRLMRANLPADMGIKAAGGIRTYSFAMELIDAGATRLGCSASMEIMKEARAVSI
jgi:deoxyribose-phosphate aldolase